MRFTRLGVTLAAFTAFTATAQAAVPPPTVLPISAYNVQRSDTVVGIDSGINVVTWKAGVVRGLGFKGLPFASAPGWVAGNLIGVDPNQGFRWHAGTRQTLP